MTPNFALAGKSVLVTGANSGIGRRIAIAAAEHGADIAVHYLANTSRPAGAEHSTLGIGAAEAVVAEIQGLGRRAVVIDGDLSVPETPARLLAQAEAEFGPLHRLVNNAAHCELPDTILEADWGCYRRHYDVNLGAPTMLMSEFARRCSGRATCQPHREYQHGRGARLSRPDHPGCRLPCAVCKDGSALSRADAHSSMTAPIIGSHA